MPLNPITQVYHYLLVLSIQVPLFKQGLLAQPLISTKNEVQRKFTVVFKPLHKLVITKNILRCLLSSNGKLQSTSQHMNEICFFYVQKTFQLVNLIYQLKSFCQPPFFRKRGYTPCTTKLKYALKLFSQVQFITFFFVEAA